jgi:SAM-dependent methyltransferase
MDVAPDGSPVAFYRRLRDEGEAALIHGLVPVGASVLDIGCGAGRIAGPLAALGHPVTGIDDGAGMVAALPPTVEGVVGDARRIRLGRRFDVVLLASHLINAPDDGRAFAETARAHVAPGGVVIGETYPPGWEPATSLGRERRIGEARVELVRATVRGDLLEAEVRYGVDDMDWRQTFTARLLDEAAVRALLRDAGLRFERWLDRPGWFVATPDE